MFVTCVHAFRDRFEQVNNICFCFGQIAFVLAVLMMSCECGSALLLCLGYVGVEDISKVGGLLPGVALALLCFCLSSLPVVLLFPPRLA